MRALGGVAPACVSHRKLENRVRLASVEPQNRWWAPGGSRGVICSPPAVLWGHRACLWRSWGAFGSGVGCLVGALWAPARFPGGRSGPSAVWSRCAQARGVFFCARGPPAAFKSIGFVCGAFRGALVGLLAARERLCLPCGGSGWAAAGPLLSCVSPVRAFGCLGGTAVLRVDLLG